MTDPDPDQAVDEQASGLSDPHRAIAALGGIILGFEALVLLMAVVPLRMLGDVPEDIAVGAVLFLTVACLVFAARAGRTWAWHGGTAVQVVLLACGLLHWALAAVGVIFGLTWAYTWSVRRKLSQPPRRDEK